MDGPIRMISQFSYREGYPISSRKKILEIIIYLVDDFTGVAPDSDII